MEKKKKKGHTTLVTAGILAVLLTATGVYFFHTPKTQPYKETRTVETESVSQAEKPTEAPVPETSYMTVTVPGYSDEDAKKAEQEEKDKKELDEAAKKAQEEQKKSEEQTASSDASAPADMPVAQTAQTQDESSQPAPTSTPVQTQTQTSQPAKQQTVTEPTIVNHYYVNGNTKASTPASGSDTVYVIEYPKNATLSEAEIQKIIMDYLGSDSTYVADNGRYVDENMQVHTGDADSPAVNTGTVKNEDEVLILTDDTASSSEDIDIVNGTTPTPNPYYGMDLEDIPSTAIETRRSSITGMAEAVDMVSTIKQTTDVESQIPTTGDIIVTVSGTVFSGNDGTVNAGSIGISQFYITNLEWDTEMVAGSGYLTDTESGFVKNIHLDDGSAMRVAVTATYIDGSVRSSSPILIAHKDYKY